MIDISESLKLLGPFGLLCHTHDHIWRDKSWPLTVRLAAFHEVWALKGWVRRRPLAAVIFILCLLSHGVSAQTVSPVITELGAKGTKAFQGSFIVNNPGLTPLTVVVEKPQSLLFPVPKGKPTIAPLAPGVTVDLSQQSAKIGAKQSAEFWYKVTCAQKPCAVVIFSTLTLGQHTSRGMSIALHLPAVIYGCERQKNCRKLVTTGAK